MPISLVQHLGRQYVSPVSANFAPTRVAGLGFLFNPIQSQLVCFLLAQACGSESQLIPGKGFQAGESNRVQLQTSPGNIRDSCQNFW